MMFGETNMHMVTFCFTVFELALLFFQVIYYMVRRNDLQRLRFLILLVLLIAYNTCSGGILPDEQVALPFVLQNILAYGLGFAVSMYAIYFYYRLFDLEHLKFLATRGLFLFLFMSFVVFVVLYPSTGDLGLSRKMAMIIPIIYGAVFVAKATSSLLVKIKESKQKSDLITADTLYLAITAHFSMMCWAALPVVNFFGDYQLVEHSLTNAGFLLMSIFYLRSATKEEEKQKIELPAQVGPADKSRLNTGDNPPADLTVPGIANYESNFKKYNLSRREVEVVLLLIKGYPNRRIADELHITEGTVSKHVSNIYDKIGVETRVELFTRLNQGTAKGE